MKWIKLFEDFKKNNREGSLITSEDIINCIKNNGFIYTSTIIGLPGNDPDEAIKPVSIDDDGLVTVEYDGGEYEVEIKRIDKIEY